MSAHDFEFTSIDGKPMKMSAFAGKPVLVVNTASKCGLTPQYAGLQALAEKYRDRLVVLGVPSNDFGGQEPGTNEQIGAFCKSKFGVTFPMFSKISVKGSDKAPLYKFLTEGVSNPKTAGEIPWNFTKYLVDRDGKVLARFDAQTEPMSKELVSAIEGALKK